MKENIVQQKSYLFAVKIIKFYKFLVEKKREYVLSKQILRSGTSIGANIEEAIGGQSRKDFVAKLTIAYKETRETSYWLRLLKDAQFVEQHESEPLLADCNELIRIIDAIQRTIKFNS